MGLLSIVIPAYNEEKRLPATLESILQYAGTHRQCGAEIIVVDDGSRDRTAAIAESHGSAVRLLRNPGNRGKGYAVRNGMLHAHGEWVLFTDADLSSPIEEVAKLMDAAAQINAAVAIGSRALNKELIEIHQPLLREASGRVFNFVMRQVTGLPFADTQCGFKLYRADAAKDVFSRQKLDGFSFDVEALVIAQSLGYGIVEVPVRWRNVEGTKVSTAQGLKSFADLIKVRWNLLRDEYH